MLITTTPLPAFGTFQGSPTRRATVGGCTSCQRAQVGAGGATAAEEGTLSGLGVVLLAGAAVLLVIAMV